MGIGNVLAQLFVEVKADTSQLSKGLKDAEKEAKGLTDSLGSLGKLLPALTVVSVVTGFAMMIHKAAEFGETVTNMATRTGMSTDAVQHLGNAAKLSGGSLQSLEQIIKLMQTSIGQAATLGGAAAASFERIGLSIRQIQGLSPDKQFYAIAAAIAAIPDMSSKVAAVRDIFGRSGTEVLVYIENLERAGALPIVTATQIKTLADAKLSIEKMDIAWTNLQNTFTATILPNLTPLINALADIINLIGNLQNQWPFAPQVAINAGLVPGPSGGWVVPPPGYGNEPYVPTPSTYPKGGSGLPWNPGGQGPFGYASGGIAMTPQMAMVGESVPEAIIPLSQMGGNNITIQAGAFMGNENDARRFARLIQDYLREDNRIRTTIRGT